MLGSQECTCGNRLRVVCYILFVYCDSVTAMCVYVYVCICLLLWEIRQLPNYSKWSILRWNRERQRGGETFSLSHQLCCCWWMQGRWKMLRREGSPPAKHRDLIVVELLNEIRKSFQSLQKLKPCKYIYINKAHLSFLSQE